MSEKKMQKNVKTSIMTIIMVDGIESKIMMIDDDIVSCSDDV